MNNQIVKFKSDTGLDVLITAQDVKNVLCPQANDKEVAMFLELCRAQRLNPFIKDAYLIKYGSAPASIVTGKEVFTKRAQANPNYQGMEHGVVFMRKTAQGIVVEKREGAAVYKEAGETLLGGWARVFMKDKHPVYCELALDEYSTGKSNWLKMPAVMINKCAQVGALRLAMPSDFQQLYTAEEMGAAGEVVLAGKVEPQQPVQSATEPQAVIIEAEVVEDITDEQIDRIDVLCYEFAGLRGGSKNDTYAALMNSATMQAAGVSSGNMTAAQAALAIQLLENWIDKAKAAKIEQEFTEYEEEPDTEPVREMTDDDYSDEEVLF